ncbi:hypothetical protein [Halomicronema hongdechloris]|nr:hypothetical protein [Halomicronema hongdechloris]
MKQRFYLSAEYAQLIAERAAAAGVPVDVYMQTLIAQDYICGAPAGNAPTPPAPTASMPDSDGVALSGDWADVTL